MIDGKQVSTSTADTENDKSAKSADVRVQRCEG